MAIDNVADYLSGRFYQRELPLETEVYRGNTKKALYVTSVGLDDNANSLVKQMHGKFRIPTLLKQVDQLCRKGLDK